MSDFLNQEQSDDNWLPEDEAPLEEDALCDEDLVHDSDGQPDEYTEWTDYMGGDDWNQGQYDYD